jgi:predicted MPP superfamily phosphohydrolase
VTWAAAYEVRAFRLRRFEVPVLAPGQRPLRVLQISDLHLVPTQRRKIEWVRALAGLEPDLVIDTGDNLGHLDAVPSVLEALGPLLERPGAFVMGSNDYYAPMLKNPVRYLLPAREVRLGKRRLPTEDLREGFLAAGWLDLDNARARLKVDHREIELVGTDDAHIRADRYAEVAALADPAADLSLGVTHAPYRRVLDPMVADGLDLVLAGHTHGGQLCVPLLGRAGDQLRPAPPAGQGLSTWSARAARPAARVRRPRYVAVRAGPVRLPARGHPADAGGETIDRAPLDLPGSIGV